MEKFLKTYSTLPNDFIEDFYKIAKESYYDDSFAINFDTVCKWLDVRKDHLKRTLTQYFKEGTDYTIKVVQVKNSFGTGGNNVEEILLKPDTFKGLCMVSQTPKAKEVRQYYLTIEKLIRDYHVYIEEKLSKKITRLETNQKPKVNLKGGVVYFFKTADNVDIDDVDPEDVDKAFIKLGKSGNVKQRFKNYNSGNADDIEPLFILEVKDMQKTEGCIKNLIKDSQYRKRKEIYKINIDLLKQIFAHCNNSVNGYNDLVHGFKKMMDENSEKTVNKQFKKMRESKNGFYLKFKANE
jgi:phage anti-repressor protein